MKPRLGREKGSIWKVPKIWEEGLGQVLGAHLWRGLYWEGLASIIT